jgi:hypothetical protein
MAFGNFSSGLVAKTRRLVDQMKTAQKEREDGVKTVLMTAETAATALGLGFGNARAQSGVVNFKGIPLDLTVSVLAQGVAYSGVLRFSREKDHSYHAHAVGNAALAVFMQRLGGNLAQKLKQQQQGPPQQQTTRGELVGEETVGVLPPPRYVHGYPAERWTVRRAA